MFIVFGATGNTGKVVAARLLSAGKKVRVAVRDPKKVDALAKQGAEVVTVDILEPASVAKALDGAEGAYLLLPPDLTTNDFLGRGQKIASAYAAAVGKLAHAVVLSSIGANLDAGTGLILSANRLEKALAATGVTRTVLRAPYFMENLGAFSHAMKSDGVLPVFGGDGTYPFAMIATKDIAQAAADALLSPPAKTEIVDLAGPANYSYVDAAALASKALGREVKVLPLPLEQMPAALQKIGISADVARLYTEMTGAFARGEVRPAASDRKFHGSTKLDEIVRAVLG